MPMSPKSAGWLPRGQRECGHVCDPQPQGGLDGRRFLSLSLPSSQGQHWDPDTPTRGVPGLTSLP